jgi:hypothetical protein
MSGFSVYALTVEGSEGKRFYTVPLLIGSDIDVGALSARISLLDVVSGEKLPYTSSYVLSYSCGGLASYLDRGLCEVLFGSASPLFESSIASRYNVVMALDYATVQMSSRGFPFVMDWAGQLYTMSDDGFGGKRFYVPALVCGGNGHCLRLWRKVARPHEPYSECLISCPSLPRELPDVIMDTASRTSSKTRLISGRGVIDSGLLTWAIMSASRMKDLCEGQLVF